MKAKKINIHKSCVYYAEVFKKKVLCKNFLKETSVKIFLYALLTIVAFIYLYPFLYMITTSLKSAEDLVDVTVSWIPKKLYLKSYILAFQNLDYIRSFFNTFLIAGIATLGHLLSCSFIGYGLARYKFRGRGIIFALVILSFIVPAQVTIIPNYINFVKFNMMKGSLPLPILVPALFGFGLKGGLFIFIFRQSFLGLPYTLEEAARIDGYGGANIYFRIMMPLTKAPMLVSGILSFVWHWNDYFEPSVFIHDRKRYILPQLLPGLYEILTTQVKSVQDEALKAAYNVSVIMAATMLVILPLLILYLFLQKRFMESIERSGITG